MRILINSVACFRVTSVVKKKKKEEQNAGILLLITLVKRDLNKMPTDLDPPHYLTKLSLIIYAIKYRPKSPSYPINSRRRHESG